LANKRINTRKKGVIALFFAFVIVSIIMIVLFAFAIPLILATNIGLYGAGDDIMDKIDLGTINDAGIRTAINDSLTTARASTADNVSILSSFFQYSWLIIIVILGLIMFLYSRRIIETQVGGIR